MLREPVDGDDPTPLIDHLLSYQRKTGEVSQILLDAPPLPDGCEELWRIFRELHSCRSVGMDAQRITYADIDAFQRVSGVILAKWEIAAIQAADAAFMKRPKPNP